jgi:hypothetical protein
MITVTTLRRCSSALALGLLLVSAAPSLASPPGGLPPGQAKKLARFLGTHPLAAPRSGYCYIDTPHTHDYPPDRPVLYQEAGDGYVFTGDPVPFGYDGDKTVYYGHHPVPTSVELGPGSQPVFCFIKGPHYHGYHPPEPVGYKTRDNVLFYIGPVPPEVARLRPQQERLLEVEYRPYLAQRPQVVVTPPPEWQGPVWVAPPPATVVVAPPAPVVPVVAAAAPATVVVEQPRPAVVVAPAAPVVVAPAAPPAVIVAPPGPPAVIVAPHHPTVIIGPGRGHPGKHKGWFKHGKW